MPVFVNQVVITGNVSGGPEPARPGAEGQRSAAAGVAVAERERLIADVTAAVMRRLELALDRTMER